MKLTPKKILDNKFESIINGYSPIMVDRFLDDVIDDYEEMINLNNELKKENDELKKKIKEFEMLLDKAKDNNDE